MRQESRRAPPQQVGRYAEYRVKMEFTLFGFEVCSSEVDDRGIDFVLRWPPATYFDVQVKSGAWPIGAPDPTGLGRRQAIRGCGDSVIGQNYRFLPAFPGRGTKR